MRCHHVCICVAEVQALALFSPELAEYLKHPCRIGLYRYQIGLALDMIEASLSENGLHNALCACVRFIAEYSDLYAALFKLFERPYHVFIRNHVICGILLHPRAALRQSLLKVRRVGVSRSDQGPFEGVFDAVSGKVIEGFHRLRRQAVESQCHIYRPCYGLLRSSKCPVKIEDTYFYHFLCSFNTPRVTCHTTEQFSASSLIYA